MDPLSRLQIVHSPIQTLHHDKLFVLRRFCHNKQQRFETLSWDQTTQADLRLVPGFFLTGPLLNRKQTDSAALTQSSGQIILFACFSSDLNTGFPDYPGPLTGAIRMRKLKDPFYAHSQIIIFHSELQWNLT